MKKSKYFIILISSIVIFLLAIPFGASLGGYGGHHIKLVFVSLVYCFATIYFLKWTVSRREIFYVISIIILFPLCTYVPIHAGRFNDTMLSFPSTLGHFYGVIIGVVIYNLTPRYRPYLAGVFISSVIWLAFYGYPMWINYINFHSFTSNVHFAAPDYKFTNDKGDTISLKHDRGKVIILDFWNTSCGVCFRKFPILDALYKKHKFSSKISIYSVNCPLKRDARDTSFQMIKNLNYSFPVLKANPSKNEFQIYFFPTVVIINKKGFVIYKGDIEKVEEVLARM